MTEGTKHTPYEVVKERRMCCCAAQPHITQENVQQLLYHPEWQLFNLSNTFKYDIEGLSIYAIREFFQNSKVPFRFNNCPRGSMTCCGSCTRWCNQRCPQDVLFRIFLLCGNILCTKDEQTRKERYNVSETPLQLMYDELTSKEPKYFVLAAMLTEYMRPETNVNVRRIIQDGGDSPHKVDYAPVIEQEEIQDEEFHIQYRKKVDPQTGEACVLYWPKSGMCPFCLPEGLVDRRRTVGNKNRRRSQAKRY